MKFEVVAPMIRKYVWEERRPLRELATKLERRSDSLWNYVQRAKLLYGDPPPCMCGLRALHPGRCVNRNAHQNPRCVDCSGPTIKHGRGDYADGIRPQQYLCRECGRHFFSCARVAPKFEDYEARLVGMLAAGEKQSYIAYELKISESTVQVWKRLLRERERTLRSIGRAA